MAKAAVFTAAFAFDDLALLVDADEIGGSDVAEAHAERVHPEVVEVLGVTRGDVAGDPLLEAELAEEPEPGREALLAVQTLFLDGFELRQVPAGLVGHGQTASLVCLCPPSVLRPGRRQALEVDDAAVVVHEQAGRAALGDQLARPHRARR